MSTIIKSGEKMRFEKGHKAATRQRIIEVAAAKFRKDGVAAVGIAGLMAEAGLTHGGFYAHFESKEALLRDALAAAMDRTSARLDRAGDVAGLEGLIRTYLRPAHRDNPQKGCAIASLGPEIARHELETREMFAKRIEAFTARIAAYLPAEDAATAIGITGILIGTLQLSRATPDEARSDQILEAGIAAALRLAGVTRPAPAATP
jgi:AcrR family transcriptional regulator